MSDPEQVTGHVQVTCSYCGGTIVLGYDDREEPAVLHSIPTCDSFEVPETPTEVLAFLAENRRRLGIADPEVPS